MVGRNDKIGSGGKDRVEFRHTLSQTNRGGLLPSTAVGAAAWPPPWRPGAQEVQKDVETDIIRGDAGRVLTKRGHEARGTSTAVSASSALHRGCVFEQHLRTDSASYSKKSGSSRTRVAGMNCCVPSLKGRRGRLCSDTARV